MKTPKHAKPRFSTYNHKRHEQTRKPVLRTFLCGSCISWFVIFLSSCTLYSPPERNELEQNLPDQFSLYSDEPIQTNAWWKSFGSQELNNLIEEGLTNSPTINQAWARLAQAQATATKAGAVRSPSLNATGKAGTTRSESTTSPLFNGTSKEYRLGLAAAYELDLWGSIKSEVEAAKLNRDASEEDFKTAAITLSAQIATRWIESISQQQLIDVLNKQLGINKMSEELIEMRFNRARATALDLLQQRQQIASTQSAIPQAELRHHLKNNELSLLLGKSATEALTLNTTNLPALGPLPPTGIPADLLANRPDVRAAGLRLKAADWQVSAAKADRLPSISLTGSAGYGANGIEVDELFDNWAKSLAASITGPLLDGGRRRAEVARTRAVANERLAAYQQVVLRAIKEVEDALIQEQKQREYLGAMNQRIEVAQSSYKEAVNRYRNGQNEYTTVLIQLNALQSIEQTLINAQRDLLIYRISLYRALGGSWPNELKQPDFIME